jgi:hypothetical protein
MVNSERQELFRIFESPMISPAFKVHHSLFTIHHPQLKKNTKQKGKEFSLPFFMNKQKSTHH